MGSGLYAKIKKPNFKFPVTCAQCNSCSFVLSISGNKSFCFLFLIFGAKIAKSATKSEVLGTNLTSVHLPSLYSNKVENTCRRATFSMGANMFCLLPKVSNFLAEMLSSSGGIFQFCTQCKYICRSRRNGIVFQHFSGINDSTSAVVTVFLHWQRTPETPVKIPFGKRNEL